MAADSIPAPLDPLTQSLIKYLQNTKVSPSLIQHEFNISGDIASGFSVIHDRPTSIRVSIHGLL